ncbi:MAG: ABC transporter permease, partial [Nitrospiraceae bacterium]
MVKAVWLIGTRQAGERPVRTFLTIAGIAIGVSVAIAIPTANETVLKSFRDTVADVTGLATLQVTGGELGLDETLIPNLLAHPAVLSASPVLTQGTRVASGPHRGTPLLVMGLDLLDAQDLKGIRVRTDSESGDEARRFDAFLAPDAVFIGQRLAEDWGLRPGSPLDLLAGIHVHRLVVRGVVESSGGVASAWSQMAVMDIAAAQAQFGLVGRLDRIDLVTDPDRPVAGVAQDIQARLPPALTVSRPSRRNEQVEHMVRAFQLNLATLSAVGLLVGLLIVYNTVSFTVVRKRREIGILRAIGMSRPGVVWLFLAQAAAMGLIGGLLGSGVGVLLAQGLAAALSQTVSDLYATVSVAGGATVTVPPQRLFQGLAVGLLVSLVGALVPSLEAGQTVPTKALAPGSYEVEQRVRAGRLAWVGGGGLMLAGLLALPGPIDGLPLFGYASAFCLLLSLSCFAPGFVALIGGMLLRGETDGHAAGSRIGWGGRAGRIGAVVRLAVGQVAQAPGRSAVTISALMMAIAIMVGVGTMVRSFRATVELWINQTVMADLIVAPVSWLEGDEAGRLA